jgi:hypothetical protein
MNSAERLRMRLELRLSVRNRIGAIDALEAIRRSQEGSKPNLLLAE